MASGKLRKERLKETDRCCRIVTAFRDVRFQTTALCLRKLERRRQDSLQNPNCPKWKITWKNALPLRVLDPLASSMKATSLFGMDGQNIPTETLSGPLILQQRFSEREGFELLGMQSQSSSVNSASRKKKTNKMFKHNANSK